MNTMDEPQGKGEGDDVTAAMTRLEAALERIAVLSDPGKTKAPSGPDTRELAERLDGMIARLRTAIDE